MTEHPDAKVYVTHLRVPATGLFSRFELHTAHRLREIGVKPAAKGGLTLAQVEFADGSTYRGAARCSPRDNYCKATGRQIAVGRAFKNAQLGIDPPYHEYLGIAR